MNPARLPLLTAPYIEKDVLKMTSAAASMDVSEEARIAMDVLSEEMNCVCYVRDADFRDLGELHNAKLKEKLVESKHFLLCDVSFNARRPSELENAGHDVLGPNSKDHFFAPLKSWKSLVAMAMCSVVRFNFHCGGEDFSLWRKRKRLQKI